MRIFTEVELRPVWNHVYFAACIAMVVTAATLRFYDLAGNALWLDEAVVANNSRESFWEVAVYTRHSNSSPLLYPYLLWIVQLVKSSEFSVRFIPALASTLTVAFFLFAMPRAGVGRAASFVAGLLAALSPAAIEHARDAREYGVDALVAAVMIFGLLMYLNRRGNRVLSITLLIAPILQYGLVLFGVATIGAAVIGTLWGDSRDDAGIASQGFIRRIRRLGQDMFWPCVCFAVGCAISLVTLSGQWDGSGWAVSGYLQQSYYHGGLDDPVHVLSFLAARNWEMLSYHLSGAAIVLALVSAAVAVVRTSRRFEFNAVQTLLVLSVATVSCAAILELYPLGDIRQNIYLSPIVFLAVGCMVSWAICGFAASNLRYWMAAATVLLLALGGAYTLFKVDPYHRDHADMRQVVATLEDHREPDDAVYAGRYATHVSEFYMSEQPDHYFYGACIERDFTKRFEECASDIGYTVDFIGRYSSAPSVGSPERLFLLFYHNVPRQDIDRALRTFYGGEIEIEPVAGELLYVVPDFRRIAGEVASSESDTGLGDLIVRGLFNVFLDGDWLIYQKRPCAPNNTFTGFSLHLVPVDENDLPDDRRRYGFDQLNFPFDRSSFREDGSCVMSYPLPQYEISAIRTTQYVSLSFLKFEIWRSEWHMIDSPNTRPDF